MIKKIEGIVLSETSYRETSKIIRVLTHEGTVSFLARGAKGLKSDLRSGTTKLTYGIFSANWKPDGLSTLIAVDVLDSFKNCKKSIEKISYATFLLDLAYQVSKNSNEEDVFTLVLSAIQKIEEGFDPLVLMNIVELKYLRYLGVLPHLDGCSLCGSKENIVTLSCDKGGYLCKNCVTNEKQVSEKAIKLIRMYYYVDISKITKLEVSHSVEEEINTFLDIYYDTYTGLYLKTKSFLKNLNKVPTK